jgi:hypothetical protein
VHTRRLLAAAAAAGMLAATIGAPALANPAKDTKAITFGVGHSLTPADVAPALGSYRSNYSVGIYRNYTSTWTLCSLNTSEGNSSFSGMDTELRVRMPRERKSSEQNLSQSIFQFSSAAKAKQVFTKVQRDVKRCRGEFTDSADFGAPEEATLWRNTYTNGTLSAVSGVPTVYVNHDWTRTIGSTVVNRVDEFATYSLVNDAIIGVLYSRSPDGQLSAKEREGARLTTKAAITNYQRTTGPKAGSIQSRFTQNFSALIDAQDIPNSLGSKWVDGGTGTTSLQSQRQRIWLCDPKNEQYGETANTTPFIGITAAPVQATTSFTSRTGRQAGVSETILDFGTSQVARQAFTRMQQQAKRCDGVTRQNISGVGGESGEQWSGTTTLTYRVGSPRITGNTASIAINATNAIAIPAGSAPQTSGQYTVYTLSGSRVVVITVSQGAPVSASQQSGAQELSKRAVARLP